MKAVATCLSHPAVSSNGVVKEYIDYYNGLGVSIPLGEGLQRVSRGSVDLTELELDIELDKDIDNKGKAPKHKYGELKNVLLSDKEKESLIEKFGETLFKEKVEEMSLAIGSKGYIYKSHYLAILQWDRREKKDGTHKANNRENGNQTNNSEKYTGGRYGKFVNK